MYTAIQNNVIQELEFEDIKLQINHNAKCLGLELYMNLNWNNYVSRSNIKKIKLSMFSYVSFEIYSRLINAYTDILCTSPFNHSIWDLIMGFCIRRRKHFIIFLNAYTISFLSWNSSCKPIYTELKLMTVSTSCLVIFKLLLMV